MQSHAYCVQLDFFAQTMFVKFMHAEYTAVVHFHCCIVPHQNMQLIHLYHL